MSTAARPATARALKILTYLAFFSALFIYHFPYYQRHKKRGHNHRLPRPDQLPSAGRRPMGDRSLAGLAEEAIDVVSRHLGYFRVPCPNELYGCASSVASRDAASHAAVCAHAPCACPGCAFLGSPAQLARHLADPAGPHAWRVHSFKYGSVLVVNVPEEPYEDRRLLVAEDDGGVFLLAVGGKNPVYRRASIACVMGNAGAAPVYRIVVMVPYPYASKEWTAASSCSAPVEFDVDTATAVFGAAFLKDTRMDLRIRINRMP